MFGQGYKDGIEYYKAERFGNAKELLERNMNNAGTDKSASNYYLGMIALHNKNNQEAVSYFQKGLDADATNPYNYVGMGYVKLLNGNSKEAEEQFKLAEKYAKKDASVQVAIARAYYDVNPTAYAKEITKRSEKAYKMNGENPDYYVFQADQAYDQKDWGQAAGMFEMAYSFAPSAVEAYVKNADIHIDVNPNYSIQQLKNLLQNNPNSALGQRELANTYYTLGKYKEAAEQYGKYVNNPNHFDRDEDRYSFLLFYGNEYQKGYDYATKQLAKDPNNFTAMRYQFMNAAQLSNLKEQRLQMAENLLAKHQANPKENVLAQIDYTLIAGEFSDAKRADEAITVVEDAIQAYPSASHFYKTLAYAYIDKENYAKASDAYQQYTSKLEKPSYNDYLQAGKLSYFAGISAEDDATKANYLNRAVDYANKAKSTDSANYSADKLLGDVKIANAGKADNGSALTDYQNAISKLEQASDASKYASDARKMCYYVANYYYTKGDNSGAKTYYQKGLVYDPDNTEIKNFVQKLK
jgi:tetratricopeptide (TPR) repeat protein